MITGAAFETGFQLSVVTLLLTASFFFASGNLMQVVEILCAILHEILLRR